MNEAEMDPTAPLGLMTTWEWQLLANIFLIGLNLWTLNYTQRTIERAAAVRKDLQQLVELAARQAE
jgi:hypothetical protein